MQIALSLVALAVAVVALVVAAVNLAPETPAPVEPDGRTEDLRGEVARLSRLVDDLDARVRATPLGSRGPVRSEGRPEDDGRLLSGDADTEPPRGADDRLKALVADAVDLKAREVASEIEVKQNKKPEMDVFAKALDFTESQRGEIEQEVMRGQRETFDILGIPTVDGANLMDELVDVIARSVAWPDEDPGWGKWLVKVMTEKIPGSDDTYAARIDGVKASVKESFKRTMSEEQYAEYREWGVDPIEIQGIAGSPGEHLERRFLERAKALSAQYPDGPPK